MTPLAKLLVARIRASGPITVAEYMADCLLHPRYGYYSNMQPFGRGGDFVTAPEISQMFGEMLGLALAQAWMDQGSPSPFVLAEIGPGKGTLMSDVLRATATVPGFSTAANVVLVEASTRLQEIQAETLAAYKVKWVTTVSGLPDGPLFLLANEFFDALPIRQFVRHGNGWRERMVSVGDKGLFLALSDAGPVAGLTHRLGDTRDGDIVETCPSAGSIIDAITGQISTSGGLAIAIDYGGWRSLGDTLQAISDHKYVPPLEHPGQADITAHVDFETLAAAANGVAVTGLTTQGDLLSRLGIYTRHRALASGMSGQDLLQHDGALKRLTGPDEMGRLFKAIGFFPKSAPPPPGFEP